MFKTKRMFLVSIVIFLLLNGIAHAQSPIKIIFNNKLLKTNVSPIMEKGTTLVPLRNIFEAFGANIEWNAQEQSITATKGNTVIWLQINNNVAKVNGKEVKLDTPAKTINGNTLVPVRFISEAFSTNISWDKTINSVVIGETPTSEVIEEIKKQEGAKNLLKQNNNVPLKIDDFQSWYGYQPLYDKLEEGLGRKPNSEEVIFALEKLGWGESPETGIKKNIIGTPELTIIVTNVTEKDIDAFEFECKLYDSFDRPVNKTGGSNNVFKGISQDVVIKGITEGETYWEPTTWNLVLYENATQVKDIKITAVHFTDGTTWNR